ncbi:DUF6489 family protein [Sphingomonas sp. Mn802worker]|uniref:DUF6489 family protein n=1 Tax=Sphingomonas sp. Mn802worker TaxID=629773 RepID=UPI0003639EF0|nr:DUF6489 family protein [Sphingomonas sp. Mn802worker]
MKVTIEVECTPEEARRAMGLPDLSPVHDRYLAQVQDAMENGGVSPEMLNTMMKSWAPMSEAGTDFWRTMFNAAAKPGS